MSLLLDHGHPEARHYPLGMLSDETALVIERVNGNIVTDANLLQLAIGSVLSKKARIEFSDAIGRLNVVTRVFGDLDDDGG